MGRWSCRSGGGSHLDGEAMRKVKGLRMFSAGGKKRV